MSKTPTASPVTEGRIFGTDWSIINVAALVRSNASRGAWRRSETPGGTTAKANKNYVRTVSALHLPTSASLIFMRLEEENCLYASLCFAGPDGFLPWDADVAEQWLSALFAQDRPRVREVSGETPDQRARQFVLARHAG